MNRNQTPWKLDRPYDPDKRAEALRQRFARYRKQTGTDRGSAKGSRMFWLLLLGLVVAGGIAASVT